jgi:hypothetical protein
MILKHFLLLLKIDKNTMNVLAKYFCEIMRIKEEIWISKKCV